MDVNTVRIHEKTLVTFCYALRLTKRHPVSRHVRSLGCCFCVIALGVGPSVM